MHGMHPLADWYTRTSYPYATKLGDVIMSRSFEDDTLVVTIDGILRKRFLPSDTRSDAAIKKTVRAWLDEIEEKFGGDWFVSYKRALETARGRGW